MDRKEELQKYLQQVANPIIEKLVADLLREKPKEKALPGFCKKWFEKYIQKTQENPQVSSDEEDEKDQVDVLVPSKAQPKAKTKSRAAVSAEVYGEYNKKEDFKPRVIQKAEDVRKRILIRLKSLQEKETDIVIDAMEEKKFTAGETIINQGEDGDCLYVVDAGQLDCYKKINGEQKHLKVYKPGEAFGELALLYSAPRAATIISKTDAVLFALDRLTFNNIVKDAAQRRRKIYDEVLQKVEILKSADPYERNQIADVLKEVSIGANDYVIKEGETGDKFYIVVKGQFIATKKEAQGKEKTVMHYKEGDYFGELALMKDIPRQASVYGLTAGKLVYIEREAFKRVIGPIEDILKRNAEAYQKFKL